MAFRFVQELHRAGVVVARRLAQTHRRLTQFLILLSRERRGRRFLQDFLVAALDGAVAHPGGPRCSVVVGDDLDFDVARPFHQLLHENGGVPERLKCLASGRSRTLPEVAPPNSRGGFRGHPLRPSL